MDMSIIFATLGCHRRSRILGSMPAIVVAGIMDAVFKRSRDREVVGHRGERGICVGQNYAVYQRTE